MFLIDDRERLCEEMLQKIGNDKTFLDFVCFSDKTELRLDGNMNRHNCKIRNSQAPQGIIEHHRDTPKVPTMALCL